jgi:hypothetical protein
MLLYYFFVAPVVIFVIVQLNQGIVRWQRFGMKENEIPSQIVALAAGISILWFPHSATLEEIVYPFGMHAGAIQGFTIMTLYLSGISITRILAQQAGAIDSSELDAPQVWYGWMPGPSSSEIGFIRGITAPIVQLFSIGPLARRLRTQAAQYGLIGACGAAYASPLLWKLFLDANSGDGKRFSLLVGAGYLLCILFGIFRWQIGANEATVGQSAAATKPHRHPHDSSLRNNGFTILGSATGLALIAVCYIAWDVHDMIAYAYMGSLTLPVLDLAILGLALWICFQPQPPNKWIYIGLAGCFRGLLTIVVLLMSLQSVDFEVIISAADVGHLVLTAALGGLGFFFGALIIREWRLQPQAQPDQ